MTTTSESDGADGVRTRYRAFLSYSHRDKRAGERLFKKLDGYRVPKPLHGRQTRFGPTPAKLYPLFRDREELPTAHDLSDRIKTALGDSAHLVVLCSPAAAQSEWVNQEIRLFREIHGPERIHPVIADGAPPDCFPPALLEATPEPVAADLRPEGDGWTDGPLKAIAGILGLSYGELRDREVERARRRTRVAVGLAGLFLALFVGASVATYIALDRSERLQSALIAILEQVTGRVDQVLDEHLRGGAMTTAEIQREIDFAKGLVDTAFTLAPENPRLLSEHGQLLWAFSLHYTRIGDTASAREAANEMAGIYDRLTEIDGENGTATLRMRSISLNRRGDALLAQGDLAGAMDAFEEGLEIARRLVSQDPQNVDWARDVSISLNRVGDVRVREGDGDGAVEAFQEALDIARRLAAQTPQDAQMARDVSVSLERLGAVRAAQGDRDGAMGDFQEALEIRRRVAERNPENPGWARGVGVSLNKIGDMRLSQGDVDGAVDAYQEALDLARRLAEQDPQNAGWARDVSVSLEKVGDVRLALRDVDGAADAFLESLDIARRLADQDPQNAEWARDVSVALHKVGDVRLAQGDVDAAAEVYQESLDIARRLVEQAPRNVGWLQDLSLSLERVGDLKLALGDRDGALEAFQEGLEIRRGVAAQDPQNAASARGVVVSYAKLAQMGFDPARHWCAAAALTAEMAADGRLPPVDAWMVGDAKAQCEAARAAE